MQAYISHDDPQQKQHKLCIDINKQIGINYTGLTSQTSFNTKKSLSNTQVQQKLQSENFPSPQFSKTDCTVNKYFYNITKHPRPAHY